MISDPSGRRHGVGRDAGGHTHDYGPGRSPALGSKPGAHSKRQEERNKSGVPERNRQAAVAGNTLGAVPHTREQAGTRYSRRCNYLGNPRR